MRSLDEYVGMAVLVTVGLISASLIDDLLVCSKTNRLKMGHGRQYRLLVVFSFLGQFLVL